MGKKERKQYEETPDTEIATETESVKQDLYELWDDVLNYLWGELKNALPKEEYEKLLDEQRTWIAEKENALEEVGKEVEGGSLYPLVVNSEAAE